MAKAYFVGSGIASLAGAAYLIRDGHFPGDDIHIFEQSAITGGSLDGAGSPETGYTLRGGRMLNFSYLCTYDLLSFIPSLDNPSRTVKDEMLEFNERVKTHSNSRLVKHGQKLDTSHMGLSNKDRLDLLNIMIHSEESLGTKRIDECFEPSFFKTNFWLMWATMFAFQPWHSAVECKRYLHRFIHEFPRINTLAGVDRTPYNQYDSVVLPLTQWLQGQGVHFELQGQVTNLGFKTSTSQTTVERIQYVRDAQSQELELGAGDLVFVTNGSMTANSRFGSMTSPAPMNTSGLTDGAWALWDTIARGRPEFGRPAVFHERIGESYWPSFTATFRDPTFMRLEQQFTGNAPGTGGLVTFVDSNWLMSIVVGYQPHFRNQPPGVYVCWGYGLSPDQLGNHVQKKMTDCTGAEILTELCYHLGFMDHLPLILDTSTCIPCTMPFITSQFLTRAPGDRPQVVPEGSTNLAFISQFCEIPEDVVFTVEYSVRAAMTAVYTLLHLDKEPPPIYKGGQDIRVLFNAVTTALR
ncbi:MAG: oleate hydratase [Thermaceae bacterium]|nr:oleate hydratase [Thermaceae bacterium]